MTHLTDTLLLLGRDAAVGRVGQVATGSHHTGRVLAPTQGVSPEVT